MRKVFLHLFIAAAMFYFGVTLSKVVNFLAPALTSSSATTIENQQLVVRLVQPGSSYSTPSFDEMALLEIFDQYGPAQTKHDRAFFERVESEHFLLFQHYRTLTRDQDIREMERSPMGTSYWWDIESIRVLGDTAVVIGRMNSHYPNGTPSSFRSINVCVKNANGWQIVNTTSAQ